MQQKKSIFTNCSSFQTIPKRIILIIFLCLCENMMDELLFSKYIYLWLGENNISKKRCKLILIITWKKALLKAVLNYFKSIFLFQEYLTKKYHEFYLENIYSCRIRQKCSFMFMVFTLRHFSLKARSFRYLKYFI